MQTLTLLTAAKPSNATQEVTFENVCVCVWGVCVCRNLTNTKAADLPGGGRCSHPPAGGWRPVCLCGREHKVFLTDRCHVTGPLDVSGRGACTCRSDVVTGGLCSVLTSCDGGRWMDDCHPGAGHLCQLCPGERGGDVNVKYLKR